MQNPFIRLLARLRVGRKLLLIYLLDLTAVIYISGILIQEKYIAIDFAQKEITGNHYIATVRDALCDVALAAVGAAGGDVSGDVTHDATGGAVASAAAGAQPAAQLARYPQALAETQRQYGGDMQSAVANAQLIQSFARLTQAGGLTAANTSATISSAHDLITRVGNQSNLILDPDLDSYYTMSLLVLRYPDLLETINNIGVRVHTRVPAGRVESNEARTRYLILEGQLDSTLKGLSSDYGEAIAAHPSMRTELEPSLNTMLAAADLYRRTARNLVENGSNPAALAQVDVAQRALIGKIHGAWDASAQQLDVLLRARIHEFFLRMWLHLGTALTLLCCILLMVYFVARQIAQPLRHLSRVMDTVRRTGDHTLRAYWNSQDEIGRLVLGFNGMLEQLDRERETQKELAATARASEAQQALVEATPVPMVVTAIPGHEVLHANQPALEWLNGIQVDPWAKGLDSSVRARFFQQLSDHGAVDEFEVRWKGGAEPAWAVLSARRLQFQGQDAVLTAFARINHLKLMEQRLELWAKVFEASSEGILIIDSELRVLTVNQAFYRGTGYDSQGVIGEYPAFLLGLPQSSPSDGVEHTPASGPGHALTELALIVARRGAWQGEAKIRKRNGETYPAWLMVSAVREKNDHVSYFILTSIDISDRKRSEARIEFLAQHDVLTELPNRALCTERLRLALQQARRSKQQVAVLFIDLDRFKNINDSLGHHIGDGLLRSVAGRLLQSVRAGDTVSRLGGDEFIIVLNGVSGVDEISHIVEDRLIPLIRQPHEVNGAEIHVSCSIGIAVFPDDGGDIDALMQHADAAMYEAKANGRNVARFFSAEMTQRSRMRLHLESSLRHAIELGELTLVYQPYVEAQDGKLAGFEGLLRWNHPELGAISPMQFIPIAEETGLIVPIGAWVIEQACAQMAAWRAQGHGEVQVSINLSAVQLKHSGLLQCLRDSLARHAIKAGRLELEITETTLMESVEANLLMLSAIRELGVRLSIDDFGTGYSSLNYLNRFALDRLKIDRSFVHDMVEGSTDFAIAKAIIGLGHTLGLRVVAEGVETELEARLLRAAGCDEFQGFFFAKPLPAAQLGDWLTPSALRVKVPA